MFLKLELILLKHKIERKIGLKKVFFRKIQFSSSFSKLVV